MSRLILQLAVAAMIFTGGAMTLTKVLEISRTINTAYAGLETHHAR